MPSTFNPLPAPDLPDEVWDALAQSEKDQIEAMNAGVTFAKPPMLLPLKPSPPKDPIPVTGVRFCHGCRTLYAAAAAAPTPQVCPACHSEHTTVALPGEVPPIQTPLFTIPEPPAANRWAIEWKWRSDIQTALEAVIGPTGGPPTRPGAPANDWVRHSVYNITSEKSARNEARRLKRRFPGKKFRVVPVCWEPVPLIP